MFLKTKYLKKSLLSSFFCAFIFCAYGQNIIWKNPLELIALQGRSTEVKQTDAYARLPKALESQVRDAVWYLGQNAAGLYIEFNTPADSIFVRYKVKGALNMPHMPTTGVSGVDLYAFDGLDKSWKWAHGRYSFKDTISYNFENIGNNPNLKYRLYLPLYNSVEWMEIGVNSKYEIKFENNTAKPIIIYGTSIAQGACATRPGMGWTNMLGRNFSQPVINLAFSGNGRLEQPILDMINKTDASVYILDCIPNLGLTPQRSEADLTALIENAVQFLRKDHPEVPIIMTGHSSSQTPGVLNKGTSLEYGKSTIIAEKTIKNLQKKGIKKLYWLSSEDLNINIDSTVDYAHPNDIGMERISNAYTKLLKKLLK